jgi:hypothetical protein
MASIARTIIGTLYLQDDMLKQASERVRELEQELELARAHIRILELKLQRRPRSAESCALLIPQAE